MNYQIDIQVRDVEHETAVAVATTITELVQAVVDREEDRYYIALVPRPEKTKAAA